MKWTPTHEVQTPRETYLVHLDADEEGCGPAYTKEEWNTCSAADLERCPEGWLFQGEVFVGLVRRPRATS